MTDGFAFREIDLSTWQHGTTSSKELEKADDEIRNYPATLARETQVEFYHGAMMEFKRFKNEFRNRVMHARRDYDSHQAASAFDHVGEFMKILSTRISEKKRTPVIWKGRKWLETSQN